MVIRYWHDGMSARDELRVRAKIVVVFKELEIRRRLSAEDAMLASAWENLCRNMDIYVSRL